ncbi:hypothetical protein BJ138DRAFT_1085416 [Hygrophoropsis aurantiaca]|uniref:Uncharacterized protein n=1 Tax=Hygrophoropsis aurantiaca TaxID=72124 RepID=A0ACB8ADW2_9AGAM|nr:hypothetical protein BJ138DRAFT_1085416 [Hygrophoropsis aurantiaca]
MPPSALAKIPPIPISLPRPIPIPRHVATKLRALFGSLNVDNTLAIVNTLPAVLKTTTKYLLYLLVLLNVRSFPFAWHVRVFLPVIVLRAKYYLFRLTLLLKRVPRAARRAHAIAWAEALCPVGLDPFKVAVSHWSWVGIDDGDYNGHLSNSSYAKTLDAARCKIVLKMFPAFTRNKGWIALGSTHYHFIREIPMFATYEVRLSIGAWDHKWMYIVSRFVTAPKRSNKDRNAARQEKTPPGEEAISSSPSTPSQSQSQPQSQAQSDSQAEQTVHALRALAEPEPDGATLHCIAISRMCFKHGRITVPPAVAMACEGFSKPPPASPGHKPESEPVVAAYSATNPPPSWVHAQNLRVPPVGSMKAFEEFLRGGWRQGLADGEGVGQRWWEEALGGVVEERRRANLEVLELVRVGMEGCRALR